MKNWLKKNHPMFTERLDHERFLDVVVNIMNKFLIDMNDLPMDERNEYILQALVQANENRVVTKV